ELERERSFLHKWNFNLREDIHSGWIQDELQKSIAETDAAIKQLAMMKPVLKYPASSMWPSFQEALVSILEVKRRALDEYNFEAKKSDKHSNDVYLSLINYFNGALLSDYNTFLNFAARDGFEGMKAIRFVPLYEIRETKQAATPIVSHFRDIPRTPITAVKQTSPIGKSTFKSLVNYVDYINETWRQISNHRDVIRNLNSSASYYASLTSYTGKGGLSFKHDGFEVPLSGFQKVVTESKSLSPAHAASLNAGAEVLLNILKEIDAIGMVLEMEVSEKKYQEDRVAHVYQLIARTHMLFETWDDRKETLYNDVQKIYDSYPSGDPSSSWSVSGRALRELAWFDHEGLFAAKGHYKGKPVASTATVSNAPL
ncbi:MAG TPA: hypothetical protein VEF04_21855, partial [Blastocatellia bacterium]|nr:hypothetical protein [Blastocatellia bacterium]